MAILAKFAFQTEIDCMLIVVGAQWRMLYLLGANGEVCFSILAEFAFQTEIYCMLNLVGAQ